MRTIRASEIGTYLYCRRAWWFRGQGVEPENGAELSAGSQYHQQHGRAVFTAGLLRFAGLALLLLALGLLAAGITLGWLH